LRKRKPQKGYAAKKRLAGEFSTTLTTTDAIKAPESVLPSRRTSVSLQAGIAIAGVIRDATNIDLVFMAGALSRSLVLGLHIVSLIEAQPASVPFRTVCGEFTATKA
jgi:hypothetical protein